MGKIIPFFIMKAKKSLGQNFLIDNNVIKRISDNIKASEKDLIIEIGPGMGALTKSLKTKHSKLLCYEIDNDMKEYLSKLEDDKTKIIFKDILESNIKDDIKDIDYDNLFIVGNLPYYITTPIIKHIIDLNLDINSMIFMVQEEVADRFSATPGSKQYGSITLFLKHYFEVEKLFKVSKYSFDPVPKVESAIIKFDKKEKVTDVIIDKYFKFIEDCFKMKRKTLRNNLKDYDWNKILPILQKYELNDNVRAEELKEEIFIEIFKSL